MIELVQNLVGGAIQAVVSVGLAVLNLGFDSLQWLHIEAPRLEGLLIGIGLAWLLRKESDSPFVRALSAPLKLVLDILDLVTDQAVDFLKDVWSVVKTWSMIPVDWVVSKLRSARDGILKGLTSVRDRLRKKKDE